MSGEEEVAKIQELSKKPSLLRTPTKTAPYFRGMNVFWISFTYPTWGLAAFACRLIAFSLNSIWLNHYGAFFTVCADQMNRSWEQLTNQWLSKDPMLVPACNAPKARAWDVYTCQEFPFSAIDDEDVLPFAPKRAALSEGVDVSMKQFYRDLARSRKNQSYFWSAVRTITGLYYTNTRGKASFKNDYFKDPDQAILNLKKSHRFDNMEKPIANLYNNLKRVESQAQTLSGIPLYSKAGVCRGASEWFIHLLFQSEKHFDDPGKHLIAVSKQFETGVSGQGVVLQGLLKPERLLGQTTTKCKSQNISTFELDHDHKGAIKKINSLKSGVYRVGALNHSFVYVKLRDGQSFMWNPDFGLYKKSAEELLDFVLEHHYERGNPNAHLYFEKHQRLPK